MARKPSNSPEDDLLSVKIKPYDEALAELKKAIEGHLKKGVKRHRKMADVEMPTAYKFYPRVD